MINLINELNKRASFKEEITSKLLELFEVTNNHKDRVRRSEVHNAILDALNVPVSSKKVNVIKDVLNSYGVIEMILTGRYYYGNIKRKEK